MSFLVYNAIFLFNRAAIGSLQHIIPVGLAVLFCVIFIKYSKAKLNKRQQEKSLHRFACFISIVVFGFHLYKISLGTYNISTDLPLYLCSLMGLVIPIFTYYRKLWMYEILLFWIIAGTLQAVLTPDISVGFPSFDYFRYWVVHLGLLTVIFYATIVLKMKPTFKSVFKSFFALQLYVIFMVIINYVLNANYFYLNQKPQSASILDYFGEWPWYIIVVQIIIIPYFLLIYTPFYFVERNRKK
ncbi:TIGR02206 family membrane protein [Sabulilitoribacter multivorans]|uniref:TIGR02206 family membrane protein n=1 Tax=Flaviramulus multivorans TaxID=1304750 RepID=A0ABS9IKH8_9FLAO|nr:TIGR02206 family membrane protein [Flaviramulus multivorans]MCF7561106.1 TIGR02206 family membrane protein [Flaviramulus multivorans]